MKKRLFIAMFFCFIVLFSCSNDNDYITYHKKVNQAELHINNKSFNKALIIYQKLFRGFPHHFYKDIHNACLCAIKTGQNKAAFELAKELVLHGYELNNFDTLGFKTLQNQPVKWKNFITIYPKQRKKYLQTLDTVKRREFIQLFEIDQRAASSGNIKYQDSLFYVLAGDLSDWINKHGFPKWFLNKDPLSFKMQTMMRHYCGLENRLKNDSALRNSDSLYRGMNNTGIKNIAKQALYDGYISPNSFVGIVSYWDNNPYGELTIRINYDNEVIYPEMNVAPEEFVKINKRRDSIGLYQVGELSADLLKSTWYSQFPFKEIKTACEACDTCDSKMDYVLLRSNIGYKAKVKYKKENKEQDGFLVPNLSDINRVYVTYTFLKEKKLPLY